MKITTQTLAEFLAERDLLIVDFEATCWQSRTQRPKAPDGCRYAGEIIEFGAVLISGRNAEIVNEFQAFVRPSLHPELTDFCTELGNFRVLFRFARRRSVCVVFQLGGVRPQPIVG